MRDEWRDDPLSGELERAVRALPRAREPGMLLEERTVRRLRSAGVLTGGGRRLQRGWLAAACAASVALFACGLVAGQWLGTRQTAQVVASQQASLEELSAVLEQTGSAYVNALARLAESPVPAGGEGAAAREDALRYLYRAANEVARLAPNDPVTAKILQGFEHAALQQAPSGREQGRQIVWF